MVARFMRRCLASVLVWAFPTFVLAGTSTQPAGNSWTVTPATISVTRSINFERQPGPMDKISWGDLFWGRDSFDLRVTMSSPAAAQIIAYGKIKFDAVTDDLGEDLIPNHDKRADDWGARIVVVIPGEDMHEIDKDERTSQGFTVRMGDLKVPNRSAKKLVHMKGSVTLRDRGTEQTVYVANLPALDGKDIVDPTLSAGGITAHVESAHSGSLKLEILFKGKALALGDIELLDSSGKKVREDNSPFMIISSSDYRDANYLLTEPLTASMRLKIQVFAGQTDQVVPFDLHDIPLP